LNCDEHSLTLLALPWCSVSYGEIYNIHSEPYEAREAFCLTRGSYNLIPGKYNLKYDNLFSVPFSDDFIQDLRDIADRK
jgi:hypothetical protein